MSAEGEAVAVEFFEYEPWVLHHFFGQEDVKTFIPGGGGELVGDPCWSRAPGSPSHRNSLWAAVLFSWSYKEHMLFPENLGKFFICNVGSLFLSTILTLSLNLIYSIPSNPQPPPGSEMLAVSWAK